MKFRPILGTLYLDCMNNLKVWKKVQRKPEENLMLCDCKTCFRVLLFCKLFIIYCLWCTKHREKLSVIIKSPKSLFTEKKSPKDKVTFGDTFLYKVGLADTAPLLSRNYRVVPVVPSFMTKIFHRSAPHAQCLKIAKNCLIRIELLFILYVV